MKGMKKLKKMACMLLMALLVTGSVMGLTPQNAYAAKKKTIYYFCAPDADYYGKKAVVKSVTAKKNKIIFKGRMGYYTASGKKKYLKYGKHTFKVTSKTKCYDEDEMGLYKYDRKYLPEKMKYMACTMKVTNGKVVYISLGF